MLPLTNLPTCAGETSKLSFETAAVQPGAILRPTHRTSDHDLHLLNLPEGLLLAPNSRQGG